MQIGYRYFEKEDLEEIGVADIDRQVIINFETRDVVDINGIEKDGNYIYRMEGGVYVEYQDQNVKAPEFKLSKKVYGLTAEIEVTDIVYKGDTAKGSIKYGELQNGTVNSWKTGSKSITIEKSGKYRVQVIDAAGNSAQKDITVEICNKPQIVAGMTPVIYNESTKQWDATSEKSGTWYDYSENKAMWANIKTVSKTANDDKTYNEAYWVWIPRYAYQIPQKPTQANSTGNPPEFKIAFLKGTTNIPVNEADLDGKKIKTADEVSKTGASAGDWVVHPAFTFGDKELEGIWVAKFEASSNAPNTVANGGGDTTNFQVNVRPNAPSWRNITVNNMFIACQNMTKTKGALEGITSIDAHMMKNVDWGAVAYLSQSKYGKNSQVWNNPYYALTQTAWNNSSISVPNNSVIITGMASKDSNGADSIPTTDCDSYNVGNGPKASTTGNVYGIYDMAGGSYEFVSAYLNNSIANASNETIGSVITADSKYKDIYEIGTTDEAQQNYIKAANRYGDAMYETSYQGTATTSYQHDYSQFVANQSYCFLRGGGRYDGGPGAGIFYFYGYLGTVREDFSFRPVIVL